MQKTILDLYKRLNTLTYTTFSQFNSLISDANPFDSYDDVDYYLSHSSRKFLSQFVYNVMSLNNIDDIDNLTNTELNLIFTTIGSKYGDKWNRIYQALSAPYNPINNYDMVEQMMVDSFGTDTTTQILNQIVKNKFNQDVTESKDERRTVADSMAGFNTSSPSPTTSSQEDIRTGQNGGQNKISTTTNGDGNTVETQTVGDGNVVTTTKEVTPYKLTRSGNIGVTTSMQMIVQELDGRKNLFKEIVYRDVDSMLTSSVYFY